MRPLNGPSIASRFTVSRFTVSLFTVSRFTVSLFTVSLFTISLFTASLLLSQPTLGQQRPPVEAPAQPPSTPQWGPLSNLGSNAFEAFFGWRSLLHLAGMGATAGLVTSGIDYEVHHTFHQNPEWGYAAFPGVIAGGLLPILLPAGMWVTGSVSDNDQVLYGAYAATQAVVLSFAWVSLLKGVTGRPSPDREGIDDMEARSREFRWGFARGGFFHGWPSGHCMVTTALTSALAHYYDDLWWVKVAGYGLSAYMFYSVFTFEGGEMHWFSDAVAGTLMGYAIGSAVGNGFNQWRNPVGPRRINIQATPLALPEGFGWQFVGTF